MEWYTPEWIFKKLNMEFDIDVCAPKGGIDYIPAKKHFCIEDDGLIQKWEGKVWMNPPFKEAGKWMTKFHEHANGVALVPVSKTKWFDKLIEDPKVKIEILPSTLSFHHDNKMCRVRSPCCLVYIDKYFELPEEVDLDIPKHLENYLDSLWEDEFAWCDGAPPAKSETDEYHGIYLYRKTDW